MTGTPAHKMKPGFPYIPSPCIALLKTHLCFGGPPAMPDVRRAERALPSHELSLTVTMRVCSDHGGLPPGLVTMRVCEGITARKLARVQTHLIFICLFADPQHVCRLFGWPGLGTAGRACPGITPPANTFPISIRLPPIGGGQPVGNYIVRRHSRVRDADLI